MKKLKENFYFILFVLKSLVVYLCCRRHLLFRYAIREKCQRCRLADFSVIYFGGFPSKNYSKLSRNIARVVFTVFYSPYFYELFKHFEERFTVVGKYRSPLTFSVL